jgi:hypothetical protein
LALVRNIKKNVHLEIMEFSLNIVALKAEKCMKIKSRFIFGRQIANVIAIFLMSFGLNGQTIVDIEVDKIYIKHGDLLFYKKGDVNEYSCEIIAIRQNDYHNQLVFECEDNDFSLHDSLMIKEDDIIKFKTIEEIDKWVKTLKFENEDNRVNRDYQSYLQHHSNNLFSLLIYRKYYKTSTQIDFDYAEFYRYVYLRINKHYYIIGLVDEDASVFGYIIPTKNGGLVTDGDDLFLVNGNKIDTIDYLRKWDANEFYRVKKVNGSFYLYDKLFNEKIIDRAFKDIRISPKLIICVGENETVVYNTQLKRENIKKLKAACDSNYVTQFIIGNKIKWMDFEGKFHDTFPKPNVFFCGVTILTNRKIMSSSNEFKELVSTSSLMMLQEEIDSTYFPKTDSIVSIRYLNNEMEHEYGSYSDSYSVFSFPYNTYLLKTTKGTKLVSVIDKNEGYKNKLINIKELQIQSQIDEDSLTNVINNIKKDIEITTLFEGEIEAFGYYHPIRFKENNLYGYYPQNKKAKYVKLEKFNFFYAEFELPNGKKGWLDIYGNEYFRD